MKVSVIGCSTSWSDRATSSYCVNDKILVDAGEGTLKYYNNVKLDVDNIEYIFITHFHSDHTIAAINHIYNVCWYQEKKINKKLSIYGPKGIKEYFYTLIQTLMPDYKDMDMTNFLNILEVNYKKEIVIDGIHISCIKQKHGKLEDVSYIFDDKSHKIGFSGDCTKTKNLDAFVEKCDKLFLECCGFVTNDKHLGYDEFIKYQNAFPKKKFFAIHCDDGVFNSEKKLKVILAKQGDIFNF